MKVALIHNDMKLKKSTEKLKINPWIGLIVALFMFVPSLYNILENTFDFRKEHIIFFAGSVLLVVSLKKLFDKILGN
jgi:hypothetical protein